MTRVLVNKSHLFVSNGQAIAAFNLKNKEDVVMLEIPWISQSVSQSNSGQPAAIGASQLYEDEVGELSRDSSSSLILQISLCQCGHHLAACNEQKQLVVWDVSNSFEVVLIRSVVRKALCVCFLPNCKQLLVADKTGDVYQFETDTRSCSGAGVLLLGHLSMILDMVLTLDNQHLITCDRDEKIRVSCFPNCYNIYSFCGGHTEFVVKLALLANNNTLVSGSGDGTVRLWNFRTGKELYRLSRGEESECLAVKTCVCSGSCLKPTLAVVYCGCTGVYLHKIQLEPGVSCTPIQELTFESEPWDVCFDADGSLWVFGSVQYKHVTKFKPSDDGKYVIVEDPLLEAINKHWKFFQATSDACSLIPILYKRSLDNPNDEYSEEKRQRIDSQSTSDPPDKKFKLA